MVITFIPATYNNELEELFVSARLLHVTKQIVDDLYNVEKKRILVNLKLETCAQPYSLDKFTYRYLLRLIALLKQMHATFHLRHVFLGAQLLDLLRRL